MWTKAFWMQAGERMARAYLTSVLTVVATATAADYNLAFGKALLLGAIGPAASAGLSMLATLRGDPNDPSFLTKK